MKSIKIIKEIESKVAVKSYVTVEEVFISDGIANIIFNDLKKEFLGEIFLDNNLSGDLTLIYYDSVILNSRIQSLAKRNKAYTDKLMKLVEVNLLNKLINIQLSNDWIMDNVDLDQIESIAKKYCELLHNNINNGKDVRLILIDF